jgi:protein-tyrosine kinase
VGKISNALNKYTRERSEAELKLAQTPRITLAPADADALVNYDRFTGHLLQQVRLTGEVDPAVMERLRKEGTVQRLLEHELIYPGGKLTPRGLEEVDRLERLGIVARRPVEITPARLRPPVPEALTPPAAIDDDEDYIAAYEPITAAEPPQPAPVELPAAAPLEPAAMPIQQPFKKEPESPVSRAETATKSVSRKAAHRFEQTCDEDRIDPNLVTLSNPDSYEAEQFKILRTNILYPVAGEPPRSILVTSTAPGEGKTFTAANLAISIALNINKHVLLLDADLRRPQMHLRFGFDEGPGLSNYLADGIVLPSLLLKTSVDKLTLLPGGPPPRNPSELISSERMFNLIAEVSARYSDRLIVIDAPPPALAAETSVLARQVDGILIVIRHGKTRSEDLTDLVQRVGEKKILGSVVNYMETSRSSYYGYKYGGKKVRS